MKIMIFANTCEKLILCKNHNLRNSNGTVIIGHMKNHVANLFTKYLNKISSIICSHRTVSRSQNLFKLRIFKNFKKKILF